MQGIGAIIVAIEVNVSQGIRFMLVGLPDNAVKESHERVVSALEHNGYPFPRKQVVINMAPADIRKEGSAYDLPIAVGIMAANGKLSPEALSDYVIMGELSLDGNLRPIRGVLPIAIRARDEGFKGLILPKDNAREAAVVNDLKVYGVEDITEVLDFLEGRKELTETVVDMKKEFFDKVKHANADFSEVKGQENAKRAFEVAAAGGHNVILIGSPGVGKTMMSKLLPTILPPLTLEEALETTKIHSVAGKIEGDVSLMTQRPYRSPHHTISDVALVGGGSFPQPGEISLAHNGVLFLDELPEFKRQVLEVLRQPLEERKINISRARFAIEYPASFMLVASMNPCPCGYYNDPTRECVCAPGVVKKYLSRISGPLLDRIDIHMEITPVSKEKLSDNRPTEGSASIRERVIRARQLQSERFKGLEGVHCNAHMQSKQLRKYAQPDAESIKLLGLAVDRLSLSPRAHDSILKMARTIADLDDSPTICASHMAEAISYRSLDRMSWMG